MLIIVIVLAQVARAGITERIEDIKSKVKSELSYELGTEAELTLEMEEAARLICKDNSYGLNEILICPSEGWLFQYLLWSSGNISGGGRNLKEEKFFHPYNSDTRSDPTGKWGALQRLMKARIPIAVSEKWRKDGEKIIVNYRIVIDADEIRSKGLPGTAEEASDEGKESVEEARDRISINRRCCVGEETQFVIPSGRTARLDCQDLGIDLTEVFLGPTEEELRLHCVWTDGHISYYHPRLNKKQTVWVPMPAKIAFLLNWNIQADGLGVRIHAETDEDKIAAIIQKQLEKTKKNHVESKERAVRFVSQDDPTEAVIVREHKKHVFLWVLLPILAAVIGVILLRIIFRRLKPEA